MSEKPSNPTPEDAAQDTDPRIVAMHRVVDLERQRERAQWEADRAAKQAAIVSEEYREARDELSGLLGYPSNSGGAKAMSSEDVDARINSQFEDMYRQRVYR